jgi:hypothetical protein
MLLLVLMVLLLLLVLSCFVYLPDVALFTYLTWLF